MSPFNVRPTGCHPNFGLMDQVHYSASWARAVGLPKTYALPGNPASVRPRGISRAMTAPTLSALHMRMLSQEGMAECCAALVGKYEWFTHGRGVDWYEDVKANGIAPRTPRNTLRVEEEPLAALGEDGKRIVCLSPYPKTRPMHLHLGGMNAFKVALHRDDFPARPGLDWSMDHTWSVPDNLKHDFPDASLGEIFAEVVRMREVVASYDPLPPGVLRVCTKPLIERPPAEWPRLIDTGLADVAQFEPDKVQGYIQL
jgi:hypothetical protein